MYRYSLHIDLWALINDAHPPPHPAPFERPFRKFGEGSSEAIPDVRVGGPHPPFSDPPCPSPPATVLVPPCRSALGLQNLYVCDLVLFLSVIKLGCP